MNDLTKALKGGKPGDKIALQIAREGQHQVILVTLGKKPVEAAKAPDLTLPDEPKAEAPAPPTEPAADEMPKARCSEPTAEARRIAYSTPARRAGIRCRTRASCRASSCAGDTGRVAQSGPRPRPHLPPASRVWGSRSRISARSLAPLWDSACERGPWSTGVRPNSSASLAGIPVGAAIVAFDGRRINASEDLVREVRLAEAGQEVELTFYVSDQLRRAKVTLAVAEAAVSPPDKLQPASPLPEWTPTDPRPAAKRPILGRMDRLLDGLGRAGELTAPRTPAGEAVNPAEWQRLLETLRGQIEVLQKRLDEQEERLQALEKAKP